MLWAETTFGLFYPSHVAAIRKALGLTKKKVSSDV
jgi:hypothetical protein